LVELHQLVVVVDSFVWMLYVQLYKSNYTKAIVIDKTYKVVCAFSCWKRPQPGEDLSQPN